ncbi:unnamed protein product [Colias eurytheme]|nr:unnamed protein product [Colias eurytheme]
MNGKIKGVYKQDVLVLVITESANEVRKIKFQIKSNTAQVLQLLSQHLPVARYQSSVKRPNLRYRNIDELFQNALDKNDGESLNLSLPASYSNFVKLCLLDPLFPQIVSETQKIIDNDVLSKKN